MVDLNPISTSTALPNTSSTQLTSMQAAITAISTMLEDIQHSIQTNAVPTSLTPSGDLALTTSLGTLTINVATQQLTQTEKQTLTQTLMDMIQAQKPLTLTVLPSTVPGQPPTQAIILVPLPQPAAAQPLPPAVQTPMPPVNLPPVTVGQTFPAEVLPNLPTTPPLTLPPQVAPLPQSATPVLPATSAPLPVLPPASGPQPAPAQTPTVAPTVVLPSAPAVAQIPVSISVPSTPAPVTQTVALPPLPAGLQIQTPATPVVTTAPPVLPVTVVASPVVAAPLPTAPQLPPTTLPALLQPGTDVSVTIDAVLPPPTANIPPPPLAPNQMIATVINQGSDGNLILKAGDATLFVRTQATAPPGSSFVISIDPAKNSAVILPPLPDINNFPSLPQAIDALAQAAPQIMQQMVANHIPQPTPAMPGALLFLFSAFKQGNLRGWLGSDAVETLMRMGKDDLVASLTRNLSQAGSAAQDNVVGEWRSYPIPLLVQQQFQSLTLYVHHERDARGGQAGEEAAKKIRFLIDMKLSKLGEMQLDGFVQPKKMDMILRSEVGLPPGTHTELRSSYLRATSAVGYAGSLNFQVGRRFWMQMQQQVAKGIVT